LWTSSEQEYCHNTVKLTLTSHAILSLIAIKPLTSYALAREMERSVGLICARAPSRIYEEPKRLVQLGLAAAHREYTGQRPRTVYRITAKGRETLRVWHGSPDIAEPLLESEALLRIFFSDQGTPQQIASALDSMTAFADRVDRISVRVATAFYSDPTRFGSRGPFAALVFSFLVQYAQFLRHWSQATKRETERWRHVSPAGKRAWMERSIPASRIGVAPPPGRGAPVQKRRARRAKQTTTR
jgi:PadR family transcriptional regulator AphA